MHSEPSRKFLPSRTLMLLGKTGSGKSSLGNGILNLTGPDAFAVTRGFAASAASAEAKFAEAHGRRITVVDTPGVQDTSIASQGDELSLLRKIGDGVSLCPHGVDAILIVLRLDVRFTNEEYSSVSKLETLFGESIWQYVILVFTHGDCVGNDAEEFKKLIDEGKAMIPSFQSVMSKVRTEPVMVDLSLNRQSGVAQGQITRLIYHIDSLATLNRAKYSGELFAQAQKVLEEQRAAKLQEERDNASLELKALRELVTNLEKEHNEDQKKIKDLEKLVKDADAKLKAAREKASNKVAETAQQKRCEIL